MIFELAEYIGILAFSLSGFYIAVRNKLDMLGVFIASFLTALGGGIIRDTIVDEPPVSLATLTPMGMVFFMVIFLYLLKFHKKQHYERKSVFVFIDSIGLVSFSITGSIIALEHSFSLSGVIILSFITAVGGGLLRDILINEIPYILKGGFYGIISIIIGILIYILDYFEYLSFLPMLGIFIFGIALRWTAFKHDWKLPVL